MCALLTGKCCETYRRNVGHNIHSNVHTACYACSSNLNMNTRTVHSDEMSVNVYKTKRRRTPEDNMKFRMPESIFTKLGAGMYVMATESISMAYFINAYHQTVCLCVYSLYRC
jgi:hypothetical protein